jgi:5'-nucleotidase
MGKYAVVAGGSTLIPSFADAKPLLSEESKLLKLTILHTNDVHSRIEPFPMDGGRNEGQAGIARRTALIKRIRKAEEHVLLLDAGDMFQGTPYFNYFNGALEIKLMSKMGYDVGTIGNHDFDAGIDTLQEQYTAHGDFSLVNCNYNFENTVLNSHVKPYTILKRGPLKIGILGVGVELDGLVPAPLFKDTRYANPIPKASKWARHLKEEEHCDFVICLSHLGYSYKQNKVSDCVLAKETENIDLIIGGHTHTFLEKPTILENKVGEEVFVTQVGWAGIVLGRLDIYFERGLNKKCIQCKNTIVG